MLEAVRNGGVHVLLYGPPVSGKLTVAQALAARTGFRIVHNHLTPDLVSEVLDRGAPGFWDLVKELRLRLSATAAARFTGSLSMRRTDNTSPASFLCTITERRRCKSIPTYCPDIGASLVEGC